MTMQTSNPSQWKMLRVWLAIKAQGLVHTEQAFVIAFEQTIVKNTCDYEQDPLLRRNQTAYTVPAPAYFARQETMFRHRASSTGVIGDKQLSVCVPSIPLPLAPYYTKWLSCVCRPRQSTSWNRYGLVNGHFLY